MNLKQEFRELLKASGWSQAEAARQLAMTPSALSQIVRENSSVRPSPVTLRLFRLLLWRKNPGAAQRRARQQGTGRGKKWEHDLIRALRQIPSATRKPILGVLYAMIEATRNRNAGTRKARRLRKGSKKKQTGQPGKLVQNGGVAARRRFDGKN